MSRFKLLISTTLILFAVALPFAARAAEPLRYNVVELQSGAEREVANDQMQAMLYIEQSDPNAAQSPTP